MSGFSFKSFTFVLLIGFLVWSSNFEPCQARQGRHWRKSRAATSLSKKKGKSHGSSHHHGSSGSRGGGSKPKSPPMPGKGNTKPKEKTPMPPPAKGYKGGQSAVFNVLDFGAKGNGNTDDTKAFQDAWAAACKVEASTIIVPAEFVFLVGPISFSGPYCQPNIVFQIDGTIIAPTSFKAWGSGLFQWLLFTKLRGITVQGGGTIDGRGSIWWKDSSLDDPIDDEMKLIVPINKEDPVDDNSHVPISSELSGKMPSIKPTVRTGPRALQ